MAHDDSIAGNVPCYPRYFRITGSWVNSYKVFLCVGIYVGVLVSSGVAQAAGVSPLRMGAGGLACALSALAGARIYFLLIHASMYLRQRSWAALWDTRRGGWSVFGSLITFVPMSFVLAWLLEIPAAAFWDFLGAGILAGGFWVRLGCVFNGCCGGRETTGKWGVRLHDVHGECKRRIPVQFLEMAWWLLGGGLYVALWPLTLPEGAYALGVLCWYGCGRFWLEPFREASDMIGRVRINQLVAGLLAALAGGALAARLWLG